MKEMILPIECSSGGACTISGTEAIIGKLYAVEYQFGNMDATADLTLTCEGVAAKPLLTLTDQAAANAWLYPRDLVHAVTNGAALTGTAGGDRCLPLLAGIPKLIVAQGGTSKIGRLILYYED